MLHKLMIFVLVLILLSAWFLWQREPRLDRAWSMDQALPAEIEINGDEITIRNVRNFRYESITDFIPDYYDTVVRLSELERVYYILEPFGKVGAAHSFLSFGFADGQYIAISVETRREKDEKFSPFWGLLREFELMYVIADERDVINLRANYRQHDVYLFPTTLSPEQAKKIFVSMLGRAEKLMETPEFYNTITRNCLTEVIPHINKARADTANDLPFDWRMILVAHSDYWAQEQGLIAQGLSMAEARERYRINELAARYKYAEDFSKMIRQVPERAEEVTARVVEVVDGDTIVVEKNSGEAVAVRYIGMDTPELGRDRRPSECLAEAAREANAALVYGREVVLTSDVRGEDRYGRWLRYVTVAGVDVGEELVRSGYARAIQIYPNLARAETYEALENNAQANDIGIWGERCAGN